MPLFTSKDHTQVASKLAENALGLFNNVHDQLQEANDVLAAGIEADTEDHVRIAKRLDDAKRMQTANESVAKKIEALLS